MRKYKKWLYVILSFILCLSVVDPISATTISELRDNVKKNQSQLKNAQQKADEAQEAQEGVEEEIDEIDAELVNLITDINLCEEAINDKEEEIYRTQLDYDAAVAEKDEQYASMKIRIQFMYERSDSFYMETLFGSNSIAGIVNRADYIEALSRYDREKLDEYVETRKYVELCKEELEAEKGLLDEAKAAVKQEEANISSLIGEKEAQIVSVSGDIQNKEAAIKEYEAMIAQENAEIAALEKAVAEERARLEAENARVYNGGMFAWPCPGYKRISDEYGNRMHPILGIEKFHNGLDMAASSGTPILAAYDGDVVAADYSGSMGNYIMIDHGSGLYTIYMHCSALYVSKGQTVSKGQNIAAVGSTGRSTGPHLHFSVRLNGNYTSPWNYLK